MPEQLTGFFLWVSLGGVLGGIFNTLIAPTMFNTVIEYPLMLVASLAIAGLAARAQRIHPRDGLCIMLVWGVFAAFFWVLGTHTSWADNALAGGQSAQPQLLALFTLLGLLVLMLIYFRQKAQPFVHMAWVAPILIISIPLFNLLIGNQEALTDRNVFGVSRVVFQPEKNAWFLRHGTTYHGMQSAEDAHRLEQTSYYAALADVYTALPKPLANAPVAVMGMGVGTVACYGKAGQTYDLFEIDPLVERIAKDTRYFTYLRDCAPEKNIVMGDGRISLSKQAEKKYGLIIIDVFSSDAIPMHVLTREAVAMYATKLREGGTIAFNVSNRHIDLLPVLSAIADDIGMVGISKLSLAPLDKPLQLSSHWVVLGATPSALASLKKSNVDWKPLPTADTQFLWRDDYSNILRSLKH